MAGRPGIRQDESEGCGSLGFTLLELLAALALVSLLSLVGFAALNLGLKGAQRSQAKAVSTQELRTGFRYLERSLSSAARTSEAIKNRLYFIGEPHEMQFLTPLALEAHTLGGLYHLRILKGRDKSGRGCLAVEQCKVVNWSLDPQGVEVRQILVDNLADLRFSYLDGTREFNYWNGFQMERLPGSIQVHLQFPDQKPEIWVIPIHVGGSRTIQQ